jgi:hypothetical protein
MRFFYLGKDGGERSTVWGYWLVEIKWLFSIVLLRFEDGSRDAYHEHAFNGVSWVLSGRLVEYVLGSHAVTYTPSLWPIFTPRERFHQVCSRGRTWVLQFRGPWRSTWREYLPNEKRYVTLANGRVERS